jgi:hypothetical protein
MKSGYLCVIRTDEDWNDLISGLKKARFGFSEEPDKISYGTHEIQNKNGTRLHGYLHRLGAYHWFLEPLDSKSLVNFADKYKPPSASDSSPPSEARQVLKNSIT